MTSQYRSYPIYRPYMGFICLCGAPLDIRYQQEQGNFYLGTISRVEHARGFCHSCSRQIPLQRTRIPSHISYSPSPHYTPWSIDRNLYNANPGTYAWGPHHQAYHAYHSPTAYGYLATQRPRFTPSTGDRRIGYAIHRSTEPTQQWYAGRSGYLRSPNNGTLARGRSSGTQAVGGPAYLISDTNSDWSTRATAGSHRSSSIASRSTIDSTPSPELNQDDIGAGDPGEIKGRQEDTDDEEEPFTVTKDGDFDLVGEQWEVPSRTEAIREAGEPVGYCDIISTHTVTDEDGNKLEVDIEERNCKVSQAMSGGLVD
ncbi:hypothetical protein F4814DRAFT_28006 [Daldinia grandis]|nr:hypothetical protein F4814DRAFT_28006 [Daldinia grandis]